MKKTYAELRRQPGAKPEPRSETVQTLERIDRNAVRRERRAHVTRNAKTV